MIDELFDLNIYCETNIGNCINRNVLLVRCCFFLIRLSFWWTFFYWDRFLYLFIFQSIGLYLYLRVRLVSWTFLHGLLFIHLFSGEWSFLFCTFLFIFSRVSCVYSISGQLKKNRLLRQNSRNFWFMHQIY